MCTIAHSVSDLSVNLITPISSSYLKIGIYTLPKTTQLVYIIRVDNQPTMNDTTPTIDELQLIEDEVTTDVIHSDLSGDDYADAMLAELGLN